MKIMGIDPGTVCMGYAVLDVCNGSIKICEAGVIEFTSRNFGEQLIEFDEFIDVIRANHIRRAFFFVVRLSSFFRRFLERNAPRA